METQTTKTSKKTSRKPRLVSKQPKDSPSAEQLEIPGTETPKPPRIPELERLAERYNRTVNERLVVQASEKELKEQIIHILHANSLENIPYRFKSLVIELEHSEKLHVTSE